ncbi:MAG: glycerol dehydrogenase, partial [Alphaproteobacteria bacterium]
RGTHGRRNGERFSFVLCAPLVLECSPTPTVDEVLGFATAVGLPVTLAEVGLADLDPATLRRIAERSAQPGESIHNEPFDVEPAAVADAILAADAAGRDWLARAGRR